MAFNWFKKIVKDHPKFWETYLSYFDENQDKKKRFVVFDCETTGLDYKSDRILSIGAVAIENNQVIGIVTDGDIRRMLNNRDTFTDLTAQDIMTKNPKNINSSILVSEALNILENNSITQLVVIDNNEYKGILHLHDILKEGIV